MSKSTRNIKDDEIWCPECGAPIKKGFFTCANCKLKVRLTEDINEKQTMKKKSKSSKSASESKKSIEKKKNIPETEKSSKSAQESTVTDNEKKELLDDIFEGDAGSLENNKSGSRPGWWSYS
ncbi:MAG: hypothetical protein ABUK08_07850 [Candidatus Humimicrobiaceae bacterium]